MTLEEFLALPDEEPALELECDGTVRQKVSPKGRHSAIQGGLIEKVNGFARGRRLSWAFPELRTIFGGAAYVPDVSVYRWERIRWTDQGEVPDDFTEAPDIAVEIVSPGQSVTAQIRRCIWYVEHGVTVALLVDPDDRSVLLLRASANPRALRGPDAVDLTDVLPDFHVTVDEIFSALKAD